MHQGKLNIHHTISVSSGFRASVFVVAGVKYEGPEGVASLSSLNFLIYYFR